MRAPLIGLPGNPVSAMVCAIIFVRPAISAMLGASYASLIRSARLAAPLKANGKRQDYIRAKLSVSEGVLRADPFALQDSSMQKVFAHADALIIRPVDAPPADSGGRGRGPAAGRLIFRAPAQPSPAYKVDSEQELK